MSRKLAAPSACPVDVTAALARWGPDSEREQLLAHVEGCDRCRAIVERDTRDPGSRSGSRSSERDPNAQADAAHEPAAHIEIGDVIGEKYRVDGLIGSGAMGSVYRAHHLKLRTDVALKVLRPERLNDANAERRFSREARATSALTSPHAVRTFDIDRLPSGVPYIVMEYLDGTDLSARVIGGGPLPLADALRYTIAACDAVGEAHGLSIIHRDIKPANLFVTKAGVLKVLDFGLAKSLPLLVPEAGSEATKTNFILGSPHYMSPEQLRSAKEVDARADIWSLGATLFHLVCGVPPFFGSNLYVLIALILNDDAPLVTSRVPAAPAALDAVVAKCLRRDREERYPSCAALRVALEEVLANLNESPGGDPPLPHAPDSTASISTPPPSLLSADEARAALSGRGVLLASGDDMYIDTMDAPIQTVPSPTRPLPKPGSPGNEGLASFVDSSDDIEKTVLGKAPFEDVPDDAPSSRSMPRSPRSLPRLYDDAPSSDPNDEAGTKLMPAAMARALLDKPAAAPSDPVLSGSVEPPTTASPPRVYDDDVDILPDMTKVMLESPPHLKGPTAPAGLAWQQQTAPMVHGQPAALPVAGPIIPPPALRRSAPHSEPPPPAATSLPTVRRKGAPGTSTSQLGGLILVAFALLLLIAALITLWSVS